MLNNTKYPILLVHGSNCRDSAPMRYWGRIPGFLRRQGISVFLGGQDAWGSIEKNAFMLKKSVFHVLKETKSEKVNIIAHSKGGLEARYMIDKLNMAHCVASLTTIATPHKGALAIDIIFFRLPVCLQKTMGFFVNVFWRMLGDQNPDFYKGFCQLSVAYCKDFNKSIKNSPSVYYQSYASVMKKPFNDLFLALTYLFISKIEGQNDGLVSCSSAKWGNFRGVINETKEYGISHRDTVDFRKKEICGFSAKYFYLYIIRDLAKRGY